MYDVDGHQIDAHGGGFLVENGTTYWYGSARLNHPDSGCVPGDLPPKLCDKGINLYSSSDLYNWKFESLVVSAINTTDNGRDLERPKVIRCGKTGQYVMWLRGTPIYSGNQLKLGVLIAARPEGPWTWVGDARDPFQLVASRYQYGDATLWQDQSTGKAYVYWRARTPTDGFRAMELDDKCTGVVPETDTQVFSSPNREAPAFFEHLGNHYLWTSGTLGWTPVQAYLYKSSSPSPLGPFNASLGHGWHAYMKPAEFNTTHSFQVRDGYLPAGNDWISPKDNITFEDASALCGAAAACKGFTFKAYDRHPLPSVTLKVSFKTSDKFVPEGDPEGLQPPPIPEPGDAGNRKDDGQPGIFSYGSQSTFILPNPAWYEGSQLPQFVYLADRWQPDTSNFGLYVWLPLFVHPNDPQMVRVSWHDVWSLDNVTNPFLY